MKGGAYPMIKIGEEIKSEKDYLYDDESQSVQGNHYELNIKPVYVSPEREKKILDSYNDVVVQEFGDEYHLPEEELRRRNMYYDAFIEISHMKNKFRRLSEYVLAMRKVLNCLEVVAQNNGVYDPEDFKNRWASGKIKVYGLDIPKYIGKDKRRISWKYISEFILSDKDPSELMKKEAEHIDSEEEMAMAKEELFDPGELEAMTKPYTKEEMEEKRHLFLTRKTENVVLPMSNKEMKLISKENPVLVLNMKDIRKRERQSLITQNAFVSDMTYSDMEDISSYDRKHMFVSREKEPEFTGSIMKKKDVDIYLYNMDRYYGQHTKELYSGKMMTPDEIRSLKLKEELQKDGWNIRKLYGNKEKIKRIKEAERMDRKKRNRLKKRLLKMNERRDRREASYRTISDNEGFKKKKKKNKKK